MPNPEYVTWKDRCLTCAYRPGTEASLGKVTQLKAQLCLESGEPFLCHADPNRIALCKGWVDALAIRLSKPKADDEARRQMAAWLAREIDEAEQAMLASQHAEAKRLYEQANAAFDAEVVQ